ncbi:carotenoid biosynthesis protein [Dictyobacter aurantiacus]|uniref:Carotenoid biosynthesis protein n=1 Tax=Dictyobacter aurantiacus TaxID=1936993 RepID=A0A401ZF96_9CHLR|nr:carotenoid biosynthesis protein [Dictyobacter aurantiacus]GCE05519.1 hypothetical protein KDAU_28480 [Dictyobacter aurantiacus]
MKRNSTGLRALFVVLIGLFVFCYPFAVIGVAFDVRPPFSLDWAGSFLLFLEGGILLLAAMLCYGPLPALCAGIAIIVLSYLVETLGVNTGFPFGVYHYTPVLLPRLPGGVPLAVMFAWILIVLGGYGIVKRRLPLKRSIRVGEALSVAILATLLDLAIEPVAAHVVLYWRWEVRGSMDYYGVPLMNFVAWFVVAFVLVVVVNVILQQGRNILRFSQHGQVDRASVQKAGRVERLAMLAPCILFSCSLFMFGLVDLTHGYFLGSACALGAGLLILLLWRFVRAQPVSDYAG